MQEIKKSEFKPENYKKLHLLTNHKNGNQTYEFECACDRCGGYGKAISHMCNGQPVFYAQDNGICYKCLGSGVMTSKLKVVADENWTEKVATRNPTREEYISHIQKVIEETKQLSLEQGYKKVDFKIASWCLGGKGSEPIDYLNGNYYIIEKETDKAILIRWKRGLEDMTSTSEWFPKKAILR